MLVLTEVSAEKPGDVLARLLTDDIYGHGRSERLLGWLVTQVPRHEIVLASKTGYFAGTAEHGFEPRHMRRQLEQSLDNLRPSTPQTLVPPQIKSR